MINIKEVTDIRVMTYNYVNDAGSGVEGPSVSFMIISNFNPISRIT
jgi:hypothetical protein